MHTRKACTTDSTPHNAPGTTCRIRVPELQSPCEQIHASVWIVTDKTRRTVNSECASMIVGVGHSLWFYAQCTNSNKDVCWHLCDYIQPPE